MTKNPDKTPSRRALLQIGIGSMAGVGLLPVTSGIAMAAASPADRALVCVYLFGGIGDANLAARKLQALKQSGPLRVVDADTAKRVSQNEDPVSPGAAMAQRYSGLRFLPNGFATPEWAARMAGLRGHHGGGAYTFRSGMSMVVPEGSPRPSGQFENTGIRQAMQEVRPLRTVFPNTAVGRQLEDVSRILRAAAKLELDRPVFLVAANGFSNSAKQAGTLPGRYRELSRAMAAFHAATVEMGLERHVTSYTDGESLSTAKERARLVMGGAALENEFVDDRGGPAPNTMLFWRGGSGCPPAGFSGPSPNQPPGPWLWLEKGMTLEVPPDQSVLARRTKHEMRTYTVETFQPYVGQILTFDIIQPDGSSERVCLGLLEVTRLSFGARPEGFREPFSLLFTPAGGTLSAGGLHRVVHDDFEPCEWFLSRVFLPRRDPRVPYYEAVFG